MTEQLALVEAASCASRWWICFLGIEPHQIVDRLFLQTWKPQEFLQRPSFAQAQRAEDCDPAQKDLGVGVEVEAVVAGEEDHLAEAGEDHLEIPVGHCGRARPASGQWPRKPERHWPGSCGAATN